MNIVRSVLGIIVGFLIGMIIVFALQMVNALLHPVPFVFDPRNPDDIARVWAALPVTAYIVLLVSYFIGLFFAGFAAAKIAGRGEVIHGFIISVLYAMIGISNFQKISMPVWVIAGSFIIYFLAGFLGALFASSLRKARQEA